MSSVMTWVKHSIAVSDTHCKLRCIPSRHTMYSLNLSIGCYWCCSLKIVMLISSIVWGIFSLKSHHTALTFLMYWCLYYAHVEVRIF